MKVPLWLRWRPDRELDEEIQAHLDLETQANVERGIAPEEARLAARRALGNVTRVRERARQADPLYWLESFAQDARYAFRNLVHHPSFTAAAILSLALGIGANSAIFSYVDGLLLRPLDVPNASGIVRVHANMPDFRFARLAYREYTALRDRSHTLTSLAAELDGFFAVQAQPAEQARVAYGDFVSANYFEVLGVQPALGRTFRPDEDSSAMREIPVMLSHGAWTSKFHSDPNIAGARIKVNAQDAIVAGVLPESFTGTQGAVPEVYFPLAAQPRLARSGVELKDSTWASLSLLGRLKPGSSERSAQADFSVLASALEKEFPETNRRRTFAVLTDRETKLQQTDLAFAAAGLLLTAIAVLRIACINVSNLLLGRAGARAKEITIRLAVGASRGRLVRQLLTESFLLAAMGTAAGLLLGTWGIRFLTSMQLPSDLPMPVTARMDERVLVYSLAVMVVSAMLFGLAPALRATKVDLISPTKDGGASRKSGVRNHLITIQAALSVLTLVTAALFVKNFFLSSQAGPGFRTENILLMSFDPSLVGYPQERGLAFYRDLQERVRTLPGVRSVTLASHVPLGPSSSSTSLSSDDASLPNVMFSKVEPGFFETMAMPILSGRALDDHDTAASPRVIVVNETLARRLWPRSDRASDALGRHVRMYGLGGPLAKIVGIARDVKLLEMASPPVPFMYIPYTQDVQGQMTLFVHTAGDPAAMAPAIRAEVKALAPDLPMFDVRTMRSVFEAFGMMATRIAARSMGAMGVIGLSLSTLGLYAVTIFMVSRRTKEIGIRMALGATRGSILRDVLSSALKVVALGTGIGLAAALATTRYFSAFMGRVSPTDPAVFLGVPLLLMAVAFLAAWVPARRASLVDPVITLRHE